MKEQSSKSNFDIYIRELDTLDIKDLTKPTYNLFDEFIIINNCDLVMSDDFTDIVFGVLGGTNITLDCVTKKDENKVRFISNIYVDTIIKE